MADLQVFPLSVWLTLRLSVPLSCLFEAKLSHEPVIRPSVGWLFGLCHNFRKRREISLPCFYRNTCYLVGRKTLLNNRSTVYPFLFQRQSSLTPNVLLPITLYGHPNVRHPCKTSVSLIYLPLFLFIAQASRALRRSACCWPTRSSTPRTSSCCAATTSAPLSTGYTDSTTNVSTLNGLSYYLSVER